MSDQHEIYAKTLEGSGDYKILRRLRPQEEFATSAGERLFVGLVLDVETTGLDVVQDEIIELSALKFSYTRSGKLVKILDAFSALQQPQRPLPEAIVALTGITDAMVAGRQIDAAAVEAFVEGVHLVIAHNAAFDRPIVEKCWPVFARLPWACSYREIPWSQCGCEGAKLGQLLAHFGAFHSGHRALDDCRAVAHLLAQDVGNGGPALAVLLDTARRNSVRVWARNAPFQAKDLLKARGYRWDDGSSGAVKAWWTDVPEDALAAEFEFLANEIFLRSAVKLPTARLSAWERYSRRIAPSLP
jgi:DNA polymerase-3 subunit epsilon